MLARSSMLSGRRPLTIRPDRFSMMGQMFNDELGSGLSAATLAQEQREKPNYIWGLVRDAATKAIKSNHRHSIHLRELLAKRVLPYDTLGDAVNALWD